MKRFEGKVAVVTGAGSGIGEATALRLGQEGAAVACVDISEETAKRTATSIADANGTAVSIAVNVADKASVTAGMARVVSELGQPHVLCNIAGIGWFAHSHEQPIEDWDRIIAVNLTGTFLMCQAALPHLMETNGNIVNTASNAGLIGQKYSAAYCASKGGVVLLTKALSNEYIDKGVRVNAVAPGGVQTNIINSFMELPEGADHKFFRKITSPLGMADPSELASLFAYIASDEARYMTGAIVAMDGGITS
jgi:NAD(P)-dependent dehydrogenase (short-subunit alcohol dehydrogenase family)